MVPDQGEVFLNTVTIQTESFLVPELSGGWRLVDEEGLITKGKVSKYQHLEDIDADCIRTMGRYLESRIGLKESWLDWLYVVPIVPGLSETMELQPLDCLIRKLYGHLEAVCTKPRTHLHVEVERVPISKARRLPVKAVAYLASHTEDWERPLIRGVLPKRILAEVRHDQIDIYENRVAARLIDNLVVYLTKRIRVIQKMLRIFRDKEDYSKSLGGTYLRQNRIFRLWGESIDTNEGRKRAESTLRELEWLKYRLMGLMDSQLYGEVPLRTYISPTLRITNIFTNEQNYRRVSELWRGWVNEGYATTKTPADINKEAQDLCEGMDRFVMLLIIRALDQLGYEPDNESLERPIVKSGKWKLEGHGIKVFCEWKTDGTFQIENNGKYLSITSFPVDLSTISNEIKIRKFVENITNTISDSKESTLVLFAGYSDKDQITESGTIHHMFNTVGNEPSLNIPKKLGFLPISPWDIGSVEKVSRALRWFLTRNRFEAYPTIIDTKIKIVDILGDSAKFDWLRFDNDKNIVTIHRPPHEYEWEILKIDGVLIEAQKEYQIAVNEHQQLSDELRDAVRNKRVGNLNQLKKNAHRRSVELERRLKIVENVVNNLKDGYKKNKALLCCPACKKQADPTQDFLPRNDGCFQCNCSKCHAKWGMSICGNGHHFPILLPGSFINTNDTKTGWIDRVYGSDLLALP
ncbi:MAG: hypothetical protein HN757_17385, partial [Calditrichaeota bacterium]|nr:hypothetical protein [Calditrichota bacterium]